MGSDHPNILTGKTVAYAEQLTVTFMLSNNTLTFVKVFTTVKWHTA